MHTHNCCTSMHTELLWRCAARPGTPQRYSSQRIGSTQRGRRGVRTSMAPRPVGNPNIL
jgi:hypothetical protein